MKQSTRNSLCEKILRPIRRLLPDLDRVLGMEVSPENLAPSSDLTQRYVPTLTAHHVSEAIKAAPEPEPIVETQTMEQPVTQTPPLPRTSNPVPVGATWPDHLLSQPISQMPFANPDTSWSLKSAPKAMPESIEQNTPDSVRSEHELNVSLGLGVHAAVQVQRPSPQINHPNAEPFDAVRAAVRPGLSVPEVTDENPAAVPSLRPPIRIPVASITPSTIERQPIVPGHVVAGDTLNRELEVARGLPLVPRRDKRAIEVASAGIIPALDQAHRLTSDLLISAAVTEAKPEIPQPLSVQNIFNVTVQVEQDSSLAAVNRERLEDLLIDILKDAAHRHGLDV